MTVEYAHDLATSLEPTTPIPALAAATDAPLVAVSGLCGGAGVSTLTYLLARWVARNRAPADPRSEVLAIDAGATTAGLSLYAGVRSSRSLARLACDVADRAVAGAPFARAADGLRILASTPSTEPEVDREAIVRVMADAKRAHRLTVVDCATAGTPAQRCVLDVASHVVWVLPATPAGVHRARLVLDARGAPATPEIVVARRDPSARKTRTRALSSLAASRHAPLVLMPSVPALSARSSDRALEQCSVTLQALATRLLP
jgi:MinD-like ATPase involved in chromosome partitioning or flagellar assembly